MMKPLLSFSAALGIVLASAARRAEATEYIFTLIDYPGATHTYAYGINDSGQIVGAYYVGGLSHGFTWSGGVYTSFDYPGAASGGSGGAVLMVSTTQARSLDGMTGLGLKRTGPIFAMETGIRH
jgi:hypothetical protein